jgi:aminopeptidase N
VCSSDLVARFQTWHGGTARGVPLQIWAPAGAKVDVDNGFLVGRRAIDFFGDVVGPYPYEKLAQVVAPLAYWSMENASVVFYGDAGTRNGQEPMTRRPMPDVAMTSAPLMVHEIAHQWFGDSVTEKRWGDVWLSESFATYFADLYTEHYDGRDAFTASLRKEREKALAAEQTEKDPVISSADDSAGPDLSHIQYVKGGWILHMLREEIGAANFFKGIRLYYQRYRDSHATTADLRNAMEEASGSKLGGFFDQWLTRIDSPKLRVRWDYDAAKQMLNLSVEQEQPGPAYRIPIEFGTADEPRGTLSISKVTMDQKNQTFALPLARRPVDVVIDPATKLLAHMRIEPR